MPLILSIETATQVCAIALHHDGQLIAHTSLLIEKSHATHLLPLIKQLLTVTPYTQKELDAIAISSGPGSYTGLRIGATTAKGLCYALDIPLIAINTLEGMAKGMAPYHPEGEILLASLLDARRDAVYCLLASPNGTIELPPCVKIIDGESFQDRLKKNKILFFGSGAEKLKKHLANNRNAIFIDHIVPTAQSIGLLAYLKYRQKGFESIHDFEPLYLSQFEG